MKDPLKYAYLLLKFRLRTEKEIRERMKRKGFSDEQIEKTIEKLKNQGFLKKGEFLREFIQSRMLKPHSRRRIAFELRRFGFDDEEIQSALDSYYNDMDVEENIKNHILRHFSPGTRISRKDLERLINYYKYRGFSTGYIVNLVKSLGFRIH